MQPSNERPNNPRQPMVPRTDVPDLAEGPEPTDAAAAAAERVTVGQKRMRGDSSP
jgi:hypothetical protein